MVQSVQRSTAEVLSTDGDWQDGVQFSEEDLTALRRHFGEDVQQGYEPNKCCNVIFTDEESMEETTCGNPCHPSEQYCHDCRMSLRMFSSD